MIGYGAITEEIVRALGEIGGLDQLAGILVRPAKVSEMKEKAGKKFRIFGSVDELLSLKPDLVAECAGHGAMREYAAKVLEKTDLLCTSVGVLADRDFAGSLKRNASRLWIPSGAVAGLDGLLAARTAGLEAVTYTSAKPPLAWKGTPGEKAVAAAGDKRITFFEGTAREAAVLYPQNVNVGAAVSFAGLGLDRTRVKLVSDPALAGPLGTIEAEGAFGKFRFDVLAYASPRNPKTSTLTAHSVIAAVRDGVCFAVPEEMLG